MIIKTSLPIVLLFASQLSFAASDKITPANKANIARQVGESVYFECKKLGPFSKDCHVNCGNGKRFRKTSGYCFYLSKGTYTLSVSTRYRNRDLLHTANVTVSEKSRFSRAMKNSIGSSQEFTASTASHIRPSIPSSSAASAASPSPSASNSSSASPSITETQFNNDTGNQALQNTISNAINVQNQEQMISNIASDSLNTNNLGNQNTLGELNVINNNIGQSPQFNNNNTSGSFNNNTSQNNNQVSLN